MNRTASDTALARILQVLGAATTSVSVSAGCDSFSVAPDAPRGEGATRPPTPTLTPQPAPTQTVDPPVFTSPQGPRGDPAPGTYAALCPGLTIYHWEEVCVGLPFGASSCPEADEGLLREYTCGLTSVADVACGPIFVPARTDPSVSDAGDADAGNLDAAATVDAGDAGRPADSGDAMEWGPDADARDAGHVDANNSPAPSSPVGSCCYALGGGCAVGRPFVVAGRARTAATLQRSDWIVELQPNLEGLDTETREALAEFYAREGVTEHASVASFARFAMQALALGAPADLIATATRAGLDEVEHARSSFGLASAYAGALVGPGVLDTTGALDPPQSAESTLVSVAQEGCVAETVSALLIAAARDAATDPVVKGVLAQVAEEELDHALLAWRFLQWALDRRGESTTAVARVFARPEQWVGFGAFTDKQGSADMMRAHGYLPRAERRQIAERALQDVVCPAARVLLDRAAQRGSSGAQTRAIVA